MNAQEIATLRNRYEIEWEKVRSGNWNEIIKQMKSHREKKWTLIRLIGDSEESRILYGSIWQESQCRTIEKGIATGSFVTLWPAINTIFSANSGREYFSSRIEITCTRYAMSCIQDNWWYYFLLVVIRMFWWRTWGSASVWWFESITTLSPLAMYSDIFFIFSSPLRIDWSMIIKGFRNSLPL